MSNQVAPARENRDPQEQPGSPNVEIALTILRELLRLKDLKERDGETVDYRQNKDAAWAAARALLHSQN